MQELESKLITFENNKQSYNVEEVLITLKAINQKTARKNSNLLFYCFFYKGDELLRTYKINLIKYSYFYIFYLIGMSIYHQFKKLKSFFMQKKPFYYLIKDIEEIQKNDNLEIKNYKIDFYIFSKNEKVKKRNFEKLYQLMYDKLFFYRTDYSNIYFGTTIETIGNFFLDSYDIISKNSLLILSSILIYTMYFYRHQLELLGIPTNIISNIQLVSIIKLYSSIIMSIIVFVIPIISLYMYILSKSSTKHSLYKALKVSISAVFYTFIISLIINLNYVQSKKNNIDNKSFFLNQYFNETIFPKIVETNSTYSLVLGSDSKLLYYFPVEAILKNLDTQNIDINVSKESFESTIIYLLKNSSYTDIKNIEVKSQKTIVESYRFLNRTDSYEYIKNQLKLLSESTTKPSSERSRH
ncbi:MAG TPA: hypothetical protein EYG73_08010 [Arcobacter sp.]|nr:hypothetical protein [Arcobacter sp.]